MMMQQETLAKLGYSELNPLQRKALAEGFLEAPRVLVSAPTASGKTLLALLSISKHFEESRKGVFYVVPLRALASEKHREFTESLASFGIKVGISTGDFDSQAIELKEYDVVIVTSEKLDSLLRHDNSWVERTGLFVFDEVHLLGDGSRGATLEMVLTKVKRSECKILALSATVSNKGAIADWLGAKLIESDYRPTPLLIGLCDSETIYFEDGTTAPIMGQPAQALAKMALSEKKGKGQALFFVATRPFTQSLAKQLMPITAEFLTTEEKAACMELSLKILKALPSPTSQCRILAECVANGVAFHNAGIENKQRALIEDGFKKLRCIKAIAATTTLSIGLDLPASWVVVRDIKRFTGGSAELLSKMEVSQMVGRAGRPRFDARGTGVLMCSKPQLRGVRDKYVFGELEDIYSQLSSEPSLRSHALALIASNNAPSFEALFDFFNSTFYAHQYGGTQELLAVVEKVVGQLKEMDFVRERKGKLLATPSGSRISELYVDPLSAHTFIQSMASKMDAFGFLMVLQKATESRPLLHIKRAEENALWEEWFSHHSEDDDEALQRYKTSKLLNAWANEQSEDEILGEFDVPPGMLHARVRIQEWLAYAYSELAYLLNQSTALGLAKDMRRRLKYGVKEELLPLISLKGVGRVRARRLWAKGIRSKEEAEALSEDQLKELWGA